MPDDLDAGLGELARQLLALVAQRVVLGGRDQGRRQRVQPVGQQRREVGVGEVGVGARRTAASTTRASAGRSPCRAPRSGRTSKLAAGVEERVDQRHARRTGRGGAARRPARGWRRRCRRARTAAPAPARPRARPASRRPVSTSSGAAGNGCSGGRPVVHAQHRAAADRLASRRRGGVVHVDVVEDEAAAVGVHDDAPRGAGGRVEAARDAVGVDVATSATGSSGCSAASARACSRSAAMSKPGCAPGWRPRPPGAPPAPGGSAPGAQRGAAQHGRLAGARSGRGARHGGEPTAPQCTSWWRSDGPCWPSSSSTSCSRWRRSACGAGRRSPAAPGSWSGCCRCWRWRAWSSLPHPGRRTAAPWRGRSPRWWSSGSPRWRCGRPATPAGRWPSWCSRSSSTRWRSSPVCGP